MRTPGALVAVGIALVLVAACGPSADQNLLSDPRQILGQTIGATATIKSVRARFDLAYQSAPEENGPPQPRQEGGWLTADVDVAAQKFAVHGARNDGTGVFDAILAGNTMFTRDTSNGRWSKITMPAGMGMNPIGLLGGGGFGVAGAPDVQVVLAAALADGSISAQLRGVEDCRTGRCYRTAVTVPPDKVWQLAMKLTGMDRMGAGIAQQPPVGDIPAISIELLTDTKTLLLIDALGSGSAQGTSASLRVQLANHNEPIAIQIPDPALVDDQGGFGLGMDGAEDCVNGDGSACEILDTVGSQLSPEPSEP
jgi:hypothetical protein